MKNTEKELLDKGWKKETLQIHLQEYDETCQYPSKHRRLTYDMRDDFTQDQIGTLRMWANEVNNRFPNIKVCITGTGFYKDDNDGNN